MNVIHFPGLLRVAFGFFGFCVGLVITLTFLSGDAQGRVNLLYLLILFVFFPVCGFLVSLVALCLPGGKGVAGWLLELPFWPQQWRRELYAMPGGRVRRAWLFYLSQIFTLALGIGCLVAFFFVLLFNDVSFVWRSTFLEAPDLLPTLNLLALPWSYWQEAQPSLALLQLSQDFRLGEQNENAQVLGQWWKYALAAQLTYNLLPRTVMLFVSRFVLVVSQRNQHVETGEVVTRFAQNSVPGDGKLAPIIREVPDPYVLLNWGNAPDAILEYVYGVLGDPLDVKTRVDAIEESETAVMSAAANDKVMVILVKSWEPPLGELRDLLEGRSVARLIMPLDWDEAQVNETRDLHLAEWRRFCGTLEDCAVLLPVTQ